MRVKSFKQEYLAICSWQHFSSLFCCSKEGFAGFNGSFEISYGHCQSNHNFQYFFSTFLLSDSVMFSFNAWAYINSQTGNVLFHSKQWEPQSAKLWSCPKDCPWSSCHMKFSLPLVISHSASNCSAFFQCCPSSVLDMFDIPPHAGQFRIVL